MRERLEGKLPDDLCAYHFRHTFATDALKRGVDPITVAELTVEVSSVGLTNSGDQNALYGLCKMSWHCLTSR